MSPAQKQSPIHSQLHPPRFYVFTSVAFQVRPNSGVCGIDLTMYTLLTFNNPLEMHPFLICIMYVDTDEKKCHMTYIHCNHNEKCD